MQSQSESGAHAHAIESILQCLEAPDTSLDSLRAMVQSFGRGVDDRPWVAALADGLFVKGLLRGRCKMIGPPAASLRSEHTARGQVESDIATCNARDIARSLLRRSDEVALFVCCASFLLGCYSKRILVEGPDILATRLLCQLIRVAGWLPLLRKPDLLPSITWPPAIRTEVSGVWSDQLEACVSADTDARANGALFRSHLDVRRAAEELRGVCISHDDPALSLDIARALRRHFEQTGCQASADDAVRLFRHSLCQSYDEPTRDYFEREEVVYLLCAKQFAEAYDRAIDKLHQTTHQPAVIAERQTYMLKLATGIAAVSMGGDIAFGIQTLAEAAAMSYKSPFGPNMWLCSLLLDDGCVDAVVGFINQHLITTPVFTRRGEQWIDEMKTGRKPNFGRWRYVW